MCSIAVFLIPALYMDEKKNLLEYSVQNLRSRNNQKLQKLH